jgi:hypothetical protein
MRARFSREDFTRSPVGTFTFTPQQGAQMRAEVSTRNGIQQAHALHVMATVTLRVYDYARENPSALLAAEGEATRILAQAGVNARWTDCPTSPAELKSYPNCQPHWQVNDYVLDVIPESMVASLGRSQEAFGTTPECSVGPYCTAIVFYDRARTMANGQTAAAPVLLGRAMAHEIGHLLLGANSHSPSGIMSASWSARELRLNAGPAMLFTEEQSRQMKTHLIKRVKSSQAQAAELGR